MHWSLVYLISEWSIRLVMLGYVPYRRSAAASRTWLLLIFFLPLPGLVVYAMFGRIYVSKRRIEQQLRASHRIRTAQAQLGVRNFAGPKPGPEEAPLLALAARLGDFEAFGGNHIELLTDYAGTIDRMVADIESAQHHVHLLEYIYGDDQTGRRVGEALKRAAKRGVQCRVLWDAVGSKRALARLGPEWRRAGIEVQEVLPVGFFRRNAARFDLRNHRKIVVIDGRTGYTGSQNIVDPGFVKGYPNEELVLRVTGPVVLQLQAVFLADHFFETNATLPEEGLFAGAVVTGDSVAQVLPSGPGYQRENAHDFMVTLLYSARRRVVMTTPYFVPDETFLQAVRLAVLRGAEVHLVLSQHANQRLTQWAQRSYYDELLAAGVVIHMYQPRFLHAKHMSVDDQLVLIGSTNLDIRSFALNAEVNLLIADEKIAARLREIQEGYFAASRVLQAVEWQGRPGWKHMVDDVARLADSLL